MRNLFTVRNVLVGALILFLAFVPVYSQMTGNAFIMTLFTRIVILAIAAVSLNLIMGYGGMVSFGHAAYLGIAGYAVGILAHEGTYSAFIQWPVAILACGVFALVTGALSLRTRGVYFIMITLAFAQMAYYVAVSLDRYGGDDGLTIQKRSDFGGLINLSNKTTFYYVCFVCLIVTCYLVWRIVNSRFGLVIQGARSNLRRMRAIGFPTFRYQLACFVIAGMLCGLSGILLANHTDFISPAIMHWTRSGDLIVMAVLGGMGSVLGPVIGAVALLVLEEWLPHAISVVAHFVTGKPVVAAKEYWALILGPMLLLVVLFARGGIDGLLEKIRRG
ncbi:MAG: branched-chain amino acid ABC transporter permease [Pseudorhodoplanes sp.]|uniref:branched-chain amino acid ABC transporter permease n=1 Tax=Pseudorhodoplanes sp. TaxID=1934341 RepID=UPI003D1285FB